MITWVLYDIKNDKTRNRVAKACKKAGLYRVQYSVFLGTLDKNEKDTLELQISDLIAEAEDSVYIFPMSKPELRETALLGQAFDKKLVSDEINAMFI